MIQTISLPALSYDRLVWLKGTDEEIKKAEEQENDLLNAWKMILSSPASFAALQFQNNMGNLCVLSKSTRYQETWQLSYFDAKRGNVEAIMHADFSMNEKRTFETHAFSELLERLCSEVTHGQTAIVLHF